MPAKKPVTRHSKKVAEDAPQRIGAITRALNESLEQASALTTAVADLDNALQPVFNNSPETEGEDAPPARAVGCIISNQIFDTSDTVKRATDLINYIISQLEL